MIFIITDFGDLTKIMLRFRIVSVNLLILESRFRLFFVALRHFQLKYPDSYKRPNSFNTKNTKHAQGAQGKAPGALCDTPCALDIARKASVNPGGLLLSVSVVLAICKIK
jgi:hypothetical protein